jgi:hypothetical protein
LGDIVDFVVVFSHDICLVGERLAEIAIYQLALVEFDREKFDKFHVPDAKLLIELVYFPTGFGKL